MTVRPIFSAMRRSASGVVLISLQVALTLAILANALYLVNERLREASTPSGVVEPGLLSLLVSDKAGDDTGAVIERDVQRLAAIPGVLSVSYVNQMPLSQSGSNNGFQVDPDAVDASASAAVYRTDANIVRTFGLQLVSGRDLRADDQRLLSWSRPGSEHSSVALISRSLEAVLFPGESAVGRTIHAGRGSPAIEVVGVVEGLVSPWGPFFTHYQNLCAYCCGYRSYG